MIEWNRDPEEGGPRARTVVTPDGWKLVLHDTDVCMLFDRNKDPLEINNLYYQPQYADTVRKLRAKIELFQNKNREDMKLPQVGDRPPSTRLRSPFQFNSAEGPGYV